MDLDTEVAPPPIETPQGWKVQPHGRFGSLYLRMPTRYGLSVIRTAAVEDDRRTWLHVSVALPASVPSWKELSEVKALFIGRDKIAYQVFVPEPEHVNLHPFCLHLWTPLDGERVTPDFRRWGLV